MSYVKLIRFIVLFTFSHGSNRNQQRGGCQLNVESDVAEQYFDVAFQTLFFLFFLLRSCLGRVVLSRLFVSKMQPEVCSSVCECP